MSSKEKSAKQRRAERPREVAYTKTFNKDWDRYYRAGKIDLNRVKEAMLLLIANSGPLGPEWLEHGLIGDYDGFLECHVGGDLLLIYQMDKSRVSFVRMGTHAELFE